MINGVLLGGPAGIMSDGDREIEWIGKIVLEEVFPGMWTAPIAAPPTTSE